ncbi:hypothetical protein HON52_02675 [Candidatus Uhrbacteria bacterium]|nr:hypothetical protein [Candidatus Uhrbacteria bacterium]
MQRGLQIKDKNQNLTQSPGDNMGLENLLAFVVLLTGGLFLLVLIAFAMLTILGLGLLCLVVLMAGVIFSIAMPLAAFIATVCTIVMGFYFLRYIWSSSEIKVANARANVPVAATPATPAVAAAA